MSKEKLNEENIIEENIIEENSIEEETTEEEMYERDMDYEDMEDDYSDEEIQSEEDDLDEEDDYDEDSYDEYDDDEEKDSYNEYDEDDDFLEEDPYVIKLDKKKKSSKKKDKKSKKSKENDETEETSDNKKKKNKSDDKSIKGLALLFAWLVFILLAVVFYFYFMDKLPFFNKEDKETTEELGYEITYEINANEDVNKLISDYYDAMETCNQATLQSLVVDPTVFDDMTFYIEKQKVMTEYRNISVYTLPGYFTGDYVVYVTYDLVIADVNSTLADIQCYYISNTSEGYKINNSSLDPSITTYMNDQLNQPDIQALYGSVKAKIDECLENDPTFKAFYDEMTGQNTGE